MGMCCSSRQLPAEEFIQNLMFDTQLLKYDYKEIENIFLQKANSIQSIDLERHISKNAFDEIIKKFYLNKNNENSEICINRPLYHKKVLEDVVFTDDDGMINLFHICLAFFSLVGHQNKYQSKEFAQLLLNGNKLSNEDYIENSIPFEFFKKSMLTYLEINLIVITNSVYNTMILNGLEDCHKFDFEHLVKEVYTEEKLNLFFHQKLENDLQWASWKENQKIELNEIDCLFKNKEYFFSFWKLRNSFLEFYKNNFLNHETQY